VESGVARSLRVILVRDRRTEQGHDAIAGVLVDRTLEAMNPFGEDREKAIHDPVPILGVDLLGEVHRALHVGKEHRYLLALALEGASRGQDLLGEMLRRVCAGVACRRRRGHSVAARLGCRVFRPRECVLLSARDVLHIDQLFDDLLEIVTAELELSPQGPHREATLLLENFAGALELCNEAHRGIAPICAAMRSALGPAPISR
jgi:hypothetical protein